jgi:hypothetical protein
LWLKRLLWSGIMAVVKQESTGSGNQGYGWECEAENQSFRLGQKIGREKSIVKSTLPR